MKYLLLIIVVLLIGGINSQIVGGRTDIDVSTPAVQSAAQFAFTIISRNKNSVYLYTLGRVTKAQSQVVAGTKYYLTIEINRTNCRSNAVDTSNCTITRTEVCHVVILSRPWLGVTQLLQSHCQQSAGSTGSVGSTQVN